MTPIVAVVIGAYLAVQAGGHLVHWLAHSPRGGALHAAHLVHHEVLYPPGDFLSATYCGPRSWRQSSTVAFLPYLVLLCALAFVLLPPGHAILASAVMLVVGRLDSDLHDALHVRGTWLERFSWFRRLRALHLEHHLDTHTNLGIHSFLWDRARGTFRPSRLAAAHAVDKGAAHLAPADPPPATLTEYLVAVAVQPDRDGPGQIELRTVYAADPPAALRAAADPPRAVIAQQAVALRGEVLALWNELGRAAFGFGR